MWGALKTVSLYAAIDHQTAEPLYVRSIDLPDALAAVAGPTADGVRQVLTGLSTDGNWPGWLVGRCVIVPVPDSFFAVRGVHWRIDGVTPRPIASA